MERDLKFCLCGKPSEEQHRRNGMIVYRGICSACLALKRRNIPEYINKDWLYDHHIVQNLSLEKLAVKLKVKESYVRFLFKHFEIEEIPHCRYCDTTENLRSCFVAGKKDKDKKSVHKLCQACSRERKCKKQREAVAYTDYKTGVMNQKKTKKERYGNEKYNNSEQAKKTIANRTEEEHNQWKQNLSISKQNRTEEEKEVSTLRLQDTIKNMPVEQRHSWLTNMGNGVSRGHAKRTPEKKYLTTLRRRTSNMRVFGVPYHVIGLAKLQEINRNKTPEEKQEIKLKIFQRKILNESFTQKAVSVSKKAFDLFDKIDNYFDSNLQFKFTKFDETGKRINKEQGVYVGNLGLSNNRCRYLDFYFKNEEGIRIAFEFDESHHKNIYEADLLRETEIFLNRPGLYLFRIPEEYYDNNFEVMFNDVINLIQDPNCETVLNYDNLTKQLANKKAS